MCILCASIVEKESGKSNHKMVVYLYIYIYDFVHCQTKLFIFLTERFNYIHIFFLLQVNSKGHINLGSEEKKGKLLIILYVIIIHLDGISYNFRTMIIAFTLRKFKIFRNIFNRKRIFNLKQIFVYRQIIRLNMNLHSKQYILFVLLCFW